MILRIPRRNNLISVLMAMNYLTSKGGYQFILTNDGFICPVVTEDEAMNVIFKSFSMFTDGIDGIIKINIPDLEAFKKFLKNVPAKDVDLSYDEHLNSVYFDEQKLSLNGKAVIPGLVKPKTELNGPFYLVEIKNPGALSEMCTCKDLGEKVEINNRFILLFNWKSNVEVTDEKGETVGNFFNIFLDRKMILNVTKVHKKMDSGSMYIKIFKDSSIPLVKITGDAKSYTVYCGKCAEEGVKDNGTAAERI